jgi:hypothetical protein
MPIRFNIYWLMIAVAVAAVPLAFYANYPGWAVVILVVFVPPAAVSLIVTTITVLRSRARGHQMTWDDIGAEYFLFGLLGLALWMSIGLPLYLFLVSCS